MDLKPCFKLFSLQDKNPLFLAANNVLFSLLPPAVTFGGTLHGIEALFCCKLNSGEGIDPLFLKPVMCQSYSYVIREMQALCMELKPCFAPNKQFAGQELTVPHSQQCVALAAPASTGGGTLHGAG
jgi:hypothetical protein